MSTGKEQIQYLESLYKQSNDSKLYTCIRILKSNYDQIGTDTSIKSDTLLHDNIQHFKTNDTRNFEIKHLTECLGRIDNNNNRDLVVEIQKQLGIYKSVLNQSGGKLRITRKYKKHKYSRKHKKSRKRL